MSTAVPTGHGPGAGPAHPSRAGDRRDVRRQAGMVAWLVVVWVGLWGDVSVGNILGGLAVALLVMLALPLPALPRSGRVRLLPLLRLVGVVLLDLTRSSVQVGWMALRPGPPPQVAVVRVDLTTTSDAVQALVAEIVSLVPGTVVLEVDDRARTLHVHVLGVGDEHDVDGVRVRVLGLEARVLAVLGIDPARPVDGGVS